MTGLMDRVARLGERMDELDNTDRLLDEARAARDRALEAVRDEWCAEARLLAGKLIERDAALAAADDRYSRLAGRYGDECERREAAEKMLQDAYFAIFEDADVNDVRAQIDAHFARYKD